MKNKLKKLRVDAGLTQAKLAAAVGVTQPNYYRWEVGQVPIPEAKLKKIAKVLKTTPEAVLGNHSPIEAAFYDDSAAENLQYYGEVAIHFCGAGEALLFSISEEAHSNLYRDLQQGRKFVTVESLSNQTVVIRTKSISDLYFSSEAFDDFGPEHGSYNDTPLQLPDPRDWEIIESIACDDVGIEDFDPANVEHIRRILRTTTDEEFNKFVSKGALETEEVETRKIKEKAQLDRIFKLATDVTYQLSTGQKRSVFTEDKIIYEAFSELIDWEDGCDDDIIRLPAEGYHRTIFINPDAIDYISIPTHKWEQGSVDATAELIDDFGDDDNKRSERKRRTKLSE